MTPDVVAWLKRPAQNLLVRWAARKRARLRDVVWIGVTGSCGKTTTKNLIAACLAASYPTKRSSALNGLYATARTILTTGPKHRFCVQEIGTARPGQIGAAADLLRPQVGVVTNIGAAHTEFLGSVEDIAREKSALLRSLPAGGRAVLCRDDAFFDTLRSAVPPAARLVTVSLNGDADYRCGTRDAAPDETEVVEGSTGGRFRIKLPMPGDHQLCNALLAVAVAREFGVPRDAIARALAGYAGEPLRWEDSEIGGVRVINDAYNANPPAMRATIDAFARLPVRGRKWLVLGGMRELGAIEKQEHLALGRYVAGGDWAGLITVGPLGRLIAEGAANAAFARSRIEHCDDAAAAARLVATRARPGDAVLVKGSRFFKLEKVVSEWRRIAS